MTARSASRWRQKHSNGGSRAFMRLAAKDGVRMGDGYELSRRERKKRDCKYAILRAARELMRERGIEVSIEEIANRADISYPTFYNYFPTKTSLYYAIYLEEIEDIREFSELELSGEPSAVARITRVFDALMQDFVEYRYLDLFLAGEVAQHTAETGEEEQFLLLFTRFIELGRETGEFRADVDARRYAVLIVGIIFSTSFYGCSRDDYMRMLRILLTSMQG